jgi:hypothetical protein
MAVIPRAAFWSSSTKSRIELHYDLIRNLNLLSESCPKAESFPYELTMTHQHQTSYIIINTSSIMSSSSRYSTSTADAMSMESTSTMESVKSLLKYILPSKHYKETTKTVKTETPAMKAERDLNRAEALYTSLRYH